MHGHLHPLTIIIIGSLVFPFSSVAADLPFHRSHPASLWPDCPAIATTEPPPCVYSSNKLNVQCSAPATYFFGTKLGFGCGGAVSNVNVEMSRVVRDGTPLTQYILTYTLYNGDGFQKDTDGFHIDAILSNGGFYRDNLTVGLDNSTSTGGIQFNLGNCYYGAGQPFRVPPFNSGSYTSVTQFYFTEYHIENLIIRVDPAVYVSKHDHC